MKSDLESSSKISIPLVRPYRTLVLALIMFGGCAAFFLHRASTNDRGLLINGLIHLDAGEADVFYAVLGVLSAGMAAMGLLGIYHCAQIREFRMLIGRKTIKLPPSVLWRSSAEVTLLIDRIVSVETAPPADPVLLTLREEGKAHSISARLLPPGWPIREVADVIIQRVRLAQQPERSPEE